MFLFGGKPDQQFYLNYCAALGTNIWYDGAQLEILDPLGTLYYLETLTNSPPGEYYRARLAE